MRYLLWLLSASVAAAAAPDILVLSVAPRDTKVEVVFKPDLVVAGRNFVRSGTAVTVDGQPLLNDCNITAPAALQSGPGTLPAGTLDRISIPASSPLAAGTTIEVLCTTVDYFESSGPKKTAKNLKASAVVPSQTDFAALLLQKIDKQIKDAKKANEKDIFASGFVTTASSGTAGGADISLNQDLKLPHLKPFLQIKKTTQEGGDAKNFEAGAKYQIFFITNRKAFESIRGMGGRPINEVLQQFNDNQSTSPYAKAFAGSTLDIAFKMEGSAGNFEVTNLVGGSAFTVRSKTAGFLNRRGFFRGFLTPFAFEGGQSHANQEVAAAGQSAATIKPDWIARYKTGAGFRLHFADPSGNSLIQRVELSADGVLRNLFLDEAMWDAQAKAITKTGQGVRAYGQVDLKVYLGESERGRYGVKLSYNRGSLPPPCLPG